MSFINFKKGILNVNSLLFVLMVFIYSTTAAKDVGDENSLIKYVILIVCIIESYFVYLNKTTKGKNAILKKEFFYLICVILIICIYSIFKSVYAGFFSFRTVKELLFLGCPMIYSFFIVNTFDNKIMYDNMKMSFWITFIVYIISLGMNLNSIINALFSSSFLNSSSALESHVYCGLALAFCVYFCYFDKGKIYKLLSVLFVFMTFKRLFIVMAFFLFFFSNFKLKDKNVSDKVFYIIVISLIVFSLFYYIIIQPENVRYIYNRYNFDLAKFTSTRTDRLNGLLNSSYKSYGFGSSTEYMYEYLWGALEMDIVKIIIELGYIPAIVLIIMYMKFSNVNYYTFIFMAFQILNLVFSTSLAGSFTWIMIFMTIGMISKEREINNEFV